MKTAVRPNLKSKTFCSSKIYVRFKEKETGYFNFKFYQKLFVILISLSAILIYPESPRNFESICETYNSRKMCNVW